MDPLTFLLGIFAFPTLFYVIAYSVPQIYMAFMRGVPNLKDRYSTKDEKDDKVWALVTGSGSGIGKALSFKLASQGLSLVLISLPDKCFDETLAQIKKEFPGIEIRSVAAAFNPPSPSGGDGKDDYMQQIIEATKDICVQCIFNNAGFIVTGFVDQTPIGKIMANVECNATAAFKIAHYFLGKLVAEKKRGCVVFTSSVAGYIPTPFAASYAATKSFVSQLACSLHIEVSSLPYDQRIDVCAVHPSPVASNFYDKVDHKIELMEQAQKSAVPPDALPNEILKSIGCCALRDLGGMAVGTRLGTFWIPYNFFTELFTIAAPFLGDYKVHHGKRKFKTV